MGKGEDCPSLPFHPVRSPARRLFLLLFDGIDEIEDNKVCDLFVAGAHTRPRAPGARREGRAERKMEPEDLSLM